jgi:hypothetical protein
MMHLHTKIRTYSSGVLLIIATKPKTKYGFRAELMLIFHILWNKYLTKQNISWTCMKYICTYVRTYISMYVFVCVRMCSSSVTMQWLTTLLRNMEIPGSTLCLDTGHFDRPNTSFEWIAILLCVWEVPDSRHRSKTDILIKILRGLPLCLNSTMPSRHMWKWRYNSTILDIGTRRR